MLTLRVIPAVLMRLLLLVAAPALAEQRVALVIGNAAYNEDAALRNPGNDATAMAAALRRLGFEVIEGKDLDRNGFFDKIAAFDDAARSANVALFFYAGHGLQVDGRNYLAPTDLKLERKQDLRRGAIELDAVMEVMRSETNLVILDACRNNPLAGELARAIGLSRAVAANRGLARVESASGTLIAYATEPGDVAADGTGVHSPFTAALLEHIETPGLSVNDLFTQVTASVLERTDRKQKPWTHTSLSKVVRLVAAVDPEPTVVVALPTYPEGVDTAGGQPTVARPAAEGGCDREFDLEYWRSVKDSTNAADFEAYLSQCPQGQFVLLARNRLKALLSPTPPPVVPETTAEIVEQELDLNRSARRLIQLGLAAEGFNAGPADGLFGRRTRSAIGKWQAAQGETSTGYLDVEAAKLLLASGRKREAEEKARRAAAEAERQRRARRPGTTFRDCDGCPEMVVVPAGWFMMGSPSGEAGHYKDEEPVHRVRDRKTFCSGRARGDAGRVCPLYLGNEPPDE